MEMNMTIPTDANADASADSADSADLHWAAVQGRDPAFDGRFVYSVRTTGVYCRPSCPSRAARRANVAFHADPAAAEAAGFRPCLRCAPHLPPLAERQRDAVARVCRLIDAADEAPDLDQRGLVLLRRDVRARALAPHQYLFGGEFAHGAVDRHARDAEQAHQRLFGRHQVAFFPAPGRDFADQVVLDLPENGCFVRWAVLQGIVCGPWVQAVLRSDGLSDQPGF